MANEFLKHKWRLWFRIFDVNKTGTFSLEDETDSEERFVNLCGLELDRKKEVTEASRQMMKEHYFRGKPGPITEQDFIEANDKEFKEDKTRFKERMYKLFNTDIGIMDFNKEGSITEEVFVNAFQGAGNSNTELTAKYFQAYGPVDGRVPNKVIVDSWVHFTTCEDDSQPDIFLTYLEAGV